MSSACDRIDVCDTQIEKSCPEVSYESKYIEVLGSRMHYWDAGEGKPVLFLHGNPSSVYLWRNIMPYVEEDHRVIAVDLIGLGQSDKPNIDYRVFDHRRYLEEFINQLKIDEPMVLVIHDWGSFLGFDYAMRHPSKVDAIVFMEALLQPIPGYDFWSPQVAEFFRAIRTPGVGEQMIFEQNLFIEQLLPSGIIRELSSEEFDAYRQPFIVPSSRIPMLQFPREIPVAGEPADVFELQQRYIRLLQKSPIPKLHIYGEPGIINTLEEVMWAKQNLPNITSVSIGDGLHYLQEDNPRGIGLAISQWLSSLD